MLPEMPRGRLAESAQAGRGNLQTQNRGEMGQELQENHRKSRDITLSWASLGAQLSNNLPATRETWLPSLDQEDPPEKGKAAHSRILAWRIPWAGQSVVSPRVGHDWETFTFTSYFPRKVLLWSRKNVSKEITFFQENLEILSLNYSTKDIIYTYLPEISNKIASKLQQLLCSR